MPPWRGAVRPGLVVLALAAVLAGCALDESGVGPDLPAEPDAAADARDAPGAPSPDPCAGVPDYEPCGGGECLPSGEARNRRCLQGACVLLILDCCRGCRPALAPGCYLSVDGEASCGCFLQAGPECR